MIDEKTTRIDRGELAQVIMNYLMDEVPRSVPEIQSAVYQRTGLMPTISQVHNAFSYIRRREEQREPYVFRALGSRLTSTNKSRNSTHKLSLSRTDIRVHVQNNIRYWGTMASTMLQMMKDTDSLQGEDLSDLIEAVQNLMPKIYEKHPEPEKFCEVVQQRTGMDLCSS